MPEWRMARPVDFELLDGEHIAIVGPNGGGKSMLVDIIIGRHPLLMRDPEYDFSPSTKELAADNIRYVTFRDSYGDYDSTYYLQQRWNQQEIDESTPRVGELLERAYNATGADTPQRQERRQHIYRLFGQSFHNFYIIGGCFSTNIYNNACVIVGKKWNITLYKYINTRIL